MPVEGRGKTAVSISDHIDPEPRIAVQRCCFVVGLWLRQHVPSSLQFGVGFPSVPSGFSDELLFYTSSQKSIWRRIQHLLDRTDSLL